MVITALLLTLFADATQAYVLPPGLLSAVCFTESAHRISASNLDDGGSSSLGVCEIKEATARDMGFRGTAAQLMQPKYNVKYAAKYLKYQLNRYEDDTRCAVAAYNAGSCRRNSRGLIMNRKYVNKVFTAWSEGR